MAHFLIQITDRVESILNIARGIEMINRVYIIDYDSVSYIGNGFLRSEYSRKKESLIILNKEQLLKTLGTLVNDECIENVEVSVSVLNRDKMDLEHLLQREDKNSEK